MIVRAIHGSTPFYIDIQGRVSSEWLSHKVQTHNHTTMASLPTTIAGITFPSTPAVRAALEHIQEKNIPSTVNHCLRSAAFALVAASKNPAFGSVDHETLVTAILLHDLGWSTSSDCHSADKRFEVDGANAARDFLSTAKTDAATSQSVWYAIALHTSPSISLFAEPVVAATSYGIMADFLGPSTPGGMITEAEFREVLKAYPRVGFKDDTFGILCGLCKNKPETTYDNFVGDLGRKFVDGYAAEWEKRRFDQFLWKALEANEAYES